MKWSEKKRHNKYTDCEIDHACEKPRFILKKSRPQMGYAVEGLLDCFVEKLNTELTEETQAARAEINDYEKSHKENTGKHLEALIEPEIREWLDTKDQAHEVNINAQQPFQTGTIIQLTDSYTLPKN